MINPLAAVPGVCRICSDFTPGESSCCRSCAGQANRLDAVAPISYSVAGGLLHRQLRGYKDDPSEAARDSLTLGLAAVLERFLLEHEHCVAAVTRTGAFGLVCAVPSRDPRADCGRSRLREILGRLCEPTVERYVRALEPTGLGERRRSSPRVFRARAPVRGADVLLVDDTWTTGASAQSAAWALRRAGARHVALVVIGRHINRRYGANGMRLARLVRFDWETCVLHGAVARER
jgi:hypothetical protein